jgi:acyl-CoA thioesterase-1
MRAFGLRLSVVLLALLGSMYFVSPAAFAAGDLKIIVFGDSISSGFQIRKEDALASKLHEKLKNVGYTNFSVTDMSVAGDTTATAISRVSSVVAKRPDMVIVALGADDALRAVNPDLIHRNISTIVGMLVQERISVVLLGINAPPGVGSEYSNKLQSSFRIISDFYKTAFYPDALTGVIGKYQLNLADGYHPNAKGVDVIVENIYRTVDAYMRAILEQRMRLQPQDGEGGVPLPPAQAVPVLP